MSWCSRTWIYLLIPIRVLAEEELCMVQGQYCLNNGVCVDDESGAFCACLPGLEGVLCECDCFVGKCENDTQTDNSVGLLKCVCSEGWFGPKCTSECSRALCSGHGDCGEAGQCICDSDWAGPKCSISLCDICVAARHGVCVNDTCVCNGDRQGPVCGCSPSEDCGGKGQCNSTASTALCICEGGYSGSSCEVPPPSPGVCSAHRRCTECQTRKDCVWEEGGCIKLAASKFPDLDNCETDTTAPIVLWVPIVVTLGVAGLVGSLLYFFRRYRKYLSVQQQLSLNTAVTGVSPVNPWFSDDATKEEYVYLDKDDDEDSVIR